MALETKGLYSRIKEALGAGNPSEIARKLNLSPQSVYLWQKGKLPGLDTLDVISTSSGTSIHWLLTGKGQQKIDALPSRGLNGHSEKEELFEDIWTLVELEEREADNEAGETLRKVITRELRTILEARKAREQGAETLVEQRRRA